ncbi:somatotropin [Alosa sapidissima]|uniref:somatotropin n=1 Tax=Alosa sapidissima TaxID=34773 RepID=UPI001C0A5213|nr:somatotropin [Alosa sapidissima]
MAKVCLLLPALLVLSSMGHVEPSENQRLFRHAADRMKSLHLMAVNMISDFENSLDFDDRVEIGSNFLLSNCFSDSIQAPTNREEIQKSTLLKVLRISYQLLVSWEYPSQAFSGTLTNSLKPNAITDRLTDLKMGLRIIIMEHLTGQSTVEEYLSAPAVFDESYLNDGAPGKIYSLMACFRRDIHRVETFLRVAHCRVSPKEYREDPTPILTCKMTKGSLLLLLLLLSMTGNGAVAINSQHLFNNAVIRVQVLHQLAARMINDFEESLFPEDRKALSRIFPLSHCISDNIPAPSDKDETQRSSVLRLLRTSLRLIETWEYPSQAFSGAFFNSLGPNAISEKLNDLKMGVSLLIGAYLNGQPDMQGNDSLPLPFEDFYLTLDDNDLSKSYRLMACFRKDMHRVETFITMARCRRSPDTNCTL